MTNPDIIPADQIYKSCCSGALRLPYYKGKQWLVDNGSEFFPIPVKTDEIEICHVMGPGNIHIYFTKIQVNPTETLIEVECIPLSFLYSNHGTVEAAKSFIEGHLQRILPDLTFFSRTIR